MNRRRFVGMSALALAGALGGCGPAWQGEQDAAERFLTDRNDGTPVALGGPEDAPVVIGFVDQVDGPTLTVRSPIGNLTTTVRLASDAKIRKDVDIDLSALKPGDTIAAFGSRQGDVFQASAVRLGGPDDALTGGAPMVFTGGPGGGGSPGGLDVVIGGPDAAPPQAGQATGDRVTRRVEPVAGTVERVDGRAITIKQADGSTTKVELADGARIQQPGAATPADLTTGTFVAAMGERSGDTFEAREVRILPAPSGDSIR
jgi:hypothetical protein